MPNIKKLMNMGVEYLVQEPLVSGTNIKTIGGESVLGSGNLQTHSTISITLTTVGWDNNEQTVVATGVTDNNTVIVSPIPSSYDDYTSSGILCTAQDTNSLTFTCTNVPNIAVTVNVTILK